MIDYFVYSNSYCGKLDECEFKRRLYSAIAFINLHTFNRINETNITKPIQIAICELIDAEYNFENNLIQGMISNKKTDVVSISYAVSDNSFDFNKHKINILTKYLAHTGLMYKGVDKRCQTF